MQAVWHARAAMFPYEIVIMRCRTLRASFCTWATLRACLYVMERYEGEAFLNAGVGEDVSIREPAELVPETMGFDGSIDWDVSKPDGTPRKLLDVGKLHALGWQASIPLRVGVHRQWYLRHLSSARAVA